MTERRPFLLRIDAGLYAALARWADDETRSLNGQIEALLRRAVETVGRSPASAVRRPAEDGHQRQPRGMSRAPVPPKAGDRAPRRRPKPAVPQPAPPQAAEPRPAAARPSQRIPADSWDAMED